MFGRFGSIVLGSRCLMPDMLDQSAGVDAPQTDKAGIAVAAKLAARRLAGAMKPARGTGVKLDADEALVRTIVSDLYDRSAPRAKSGQKTTEMNEREVHELVLTELENTSPGRLEKIVDLFKERVADLRNASRTDVHIKGNGEATLKYSTVYVGGSAQSKAEGEASLRFGASKIGDKGEDLA